MHPVGPDERRPCGSRNDHALTLYGPSIDVFESNGIDTHETSRDLAVVGQPSRHRWNGPFIAGVGDRCVQLHIDGDTLRSRLAEEDDPYCTDDLRNTLSTDNWLSGVHCETNYLYVA